MQAAHNTRSILPTPSRTCATARCPTTISNRSIAEAGLRPNGTPSRSASRRSSSSPLLPPEGSADESGLSDSVFLQLVSSARVPAHVECALDVELMATTAGSHAQIEVVHLAQPNLSFRAWMHRIPHDCVDVTIRHKSQWPGTALYQFVAAHE